MVSVAALRGWRRSNHDKLGPSPRHHKSRPQLDSGSETKAGIMTPGDAGQRRRKAIDPEHSNVDPDEEAARNRNTLLSYFNDIASIPTLTKDEEVMLAKEMESATHEMRSGILSRLVHVARGDRHLAGLQAENRVTAKMSEAYGSGTPEGEERGEKLDKCLKKVEALLAQLRRARGVGARTSKDALAQARARASRRRCARRTSRCRSSSASAASCAARATRWRATSARSAI